jgi:23S rRNA (guanosine2251-2'-O)-methyltransferase
MLGWLALILFPLSEDVPAVALELKNPHSVLATLATRPGDVVEVRLGDNRASGAWAEVAEKAAAQRIPVVHQAIAKESGRRPRHATVIHASRGGGASARVKEHAGTSLPELFANAETLGETPGLWLALDRLQDPQNVGAIFRTASFFGVRGIVITRDRSAPLNATVYDVASGGVEHVPFCMQTNLARTLQAAKESGVWVLGSSERGDTDISDIPRDRPWLLVVGNEEKGLRRLTLDNCDMQCRLTPTGAIASLNVSVAAAVLMSALSAT